MGSGIKDVLTSTVNFEVFSTSDSARSWAIGVDIWNQGHVLFRNVDTDNVWIHSLIDLSKISLNDRVLSKLAKGYQSLGESMFDFEQFEFKV